MYAKCATTAPILVPPPVTLTISSGVRLTVRRICSICAAQSRFPDDPHRPRLAASKMDARRPASGTVVYSYRDSQFRRAARAKSLVLCSTVARTQRV